MAVIELKNIVKQFPARRGGRVLVGKGGLQDWLKGHRSGTFTALNDVDFNIEAGESLGIIGSNGSGKSTLLKIIAGVTTPTSGTVNVYGRVASLLELGAGFHPMLTGRENIYLNAGLLGMRRSQVDEVFNDIVAFSGIDKFIDYPVDTYSSGMYVRIAFAVAAFTNPDIFLIDEVLAVGDEEFQRRCRKRIGEFAEMGKTIVFVSHDLGIVNSLCNRVVLLSQGKVIQRSSTTKAIDFYLRQIGREDGLHTLSAGPLEVIFCDGRISIFHNEEEVTSASGIQGQFFYLGYWHGTMSATWTVTERGPTRCVARGEMSKLAMTLVWTLEIVDGEIVWTFDLECEESLDTDTLEINMYFPNRYTRWFFDDETGAFVDINPDDTTWMLMKAPELLCEKAGMLSDAEAEAPTVGITFDEHRPAMRGSWSNSEFMMNARVFRIEEHPAENREALESGTHRMFRTRFSIGTDRESFERALGERSAKHTVASGRLRGRFDRGQLRLNYDGEQISSVLHTYTSVLIENLWNDSINLRWDSIERDGDTLHVIGTSRRFPFRQYWTIAPGDGDSLLLSIDLEALEELTVQEYHASLLLQEKYDHWALESENGPFPDIKPEDTDWTHLNQHYAPGTWVEATGSGLPRVRFELLENDDPFRMSVLNPGYRQRARVLQTLRTPEHGLMVFPAGRHPYCRARIVVSDQ